MKRQLTIFLFLLLTIGAHAQLEGFSMATDVSIQRNFKKDQRFWSIGQTINTLYHLTKKDNIYVWFTYYSNGKFHNDLTATTKSPTTVPATINYRNDARMRTRQISIGYRKYLKGSFDAEKGWNLYAYGGLGVMLGRIQNTHSVTIDTTLYYVPVRSGKANFKRLTLDLGIGADFPIGGDFYIYSEARVWIPTTDYPSKYLFVNKDAPFAAMFCTGLRLVF